MAIIFALFKLVFPIINATAAPGENILRFKAYRLHRAGILSRKTLKFYWPLYDISGFLAFFIPPALI